jgi:hypothetical protein
LGANIAGSAGAGALSGAAREYLKLRKESISNASWSSGELAPASADERRLQKLKEEVKARWRVEKRVWDEVDKRKLRNAALRGALTGALGGAVGGFVVQHAPELIHNVGQAVGLLKESVKGNSIAVGLPDKFVVEKAGKVSGTLWGSTREMLSKALGGSATNGQLRQVVGAIIKDNPQVGNPNFVEGKTIKIGENIIKKVADIEKIKNLIAEGKAVVLRGRTVNEVARELIRQRHLNLSVNDVTKKLLTLNHIRGMGVEPPAGATDWLNSSQLSPNMVLNVDIR